MAGRPERKRKAQLAVIVNPYGENKIGGRSKYRSDFHPEEAIRLMDQGYSLVELAGVFRVGKDTLRRWMETHQEFEDAIVLGSDLCEAWWTAQGRANLHMPGFNTMLWNQNMQNRFAWAKKSSKEEKHEYKFTKQLAITAEKEAEGRVKKARVLEILQEIGALPTLPEGRQPQSETSGTVDTEAYEVHPPRTNSKTNGVPVTR